MGSFKQHITCSTITGVCFGGIVYQFGFSIPVCLLSAGLCSIAGMLPDIDSDSSRSFQECIYFAAGLCAVLLVDRLRQFNIERDTVLLAGASMFMFVRFGIGNAIKHITAHRGMFHSIPAAFLGGQLVFFLSSGNVEERLCKSAALVAGYFSHLILDEICSIDSTGSTLRFKKSFGTALKFYDKKKLGTSLALYAVVIGLTAVAIKNPKSLDGTDTLETRIQQALKDSPLRQQDIASLVSFVKRSVPDADNANSTKNTVPEQYVSVVPEIAAVPVVKPAITVQEQMQEDIMPTDYISEDISPQQTAALPFTVPQQSIVQNTVQNTLQQSAVLLPFAVPASVNTAADNAPLPFALPF